jgi:hypothetical protein
MCFPAAVRYLISHRAFFSGSVSFSVMELAVHKSKQDEGTARALSRPEFFPYTLRIPDRWWYTVPVEMVGRVLPEIRDGFSATVADEASRATSNWRSHSTGVIDYLNSRLNAGLTQPPKFL